MQKILPVAGGIKAYVASPDGLLDSESRRCPFCSDRHRLRIHGWYHRYAIQPRTPEGEVPRIRVRRLLCVRQGRTVSLLPEFCLPRRQQGPAIRSVVPARRWRLGDRKCREPRMNVSARGPSPESPASLSKGRLLVAEEPRTGEGPNWGPNFPHEFGAIPISHRR